VAPLALASRRTHLRRWLGAVGSRARLIGRLTLHSLWRGVIGMYHGDDLTHAASIAYYALLSLLPFLLLAFSVLGVVTADEQAREAAANFILRYFPSRFEFVASQLDTLSDSPVRLGVAGLLDWADAQPARTIDLTTTGLTAAAFDQRRASRIASGSSRRRPIQLAVRTIAGKATPMQARTMWKASVNAISSRAASRFDSVAARGRESSSGIYAPALAWR